MGGQGGMRKWPAVEAESIAISEWREADYEVGLSEIDRLVERVERGDIEGVLADQRDVDGGGVAMYRRLKRDARRHRRNDDPYRAAMAPSDNPPVRNRRRKWGDEWWREHTSALRETKAAIDRLEYSLERHGYYVVGPHCHLTYNPIGPRTAESLRIIERATHAHVDAGHDGTSSECDDVRCMMYWSLAMGGWSVGW